MSRHDGETVSRRDGSTIPAPGPDTSEAARVASVPRALAARLRRAAEAERTAAQIAAGEQPVSERVPDSAARAADERAAVTEPGSGAD